MAASLVPSDGADCLDRLGKNFQLAEEVVGALSKAGIANLEEFRFFFDAEAKVEPWLGKIQLGAEAQIQAARLRRAWHAVSLYYKTAEQDRSRVAIEDLDSLLGDTELRSAKEAFWVRYKLRFPTEVYPSDAAVSRASREMSKRLLCVTSVWKVKTLQWQLGTSSKKRKLGEGLWTEEPEDEQPGHQDWETYLDRLFTLLLAYALGGVKALDNAPSAKEEDVLGADTTRFVSVPLDVVMRYHARARRTSASLPHASRLAWLLQRDTEERADWVSRFRESTLTLGQVIKATYEARDAHWVPAGNFSAPTKERQQASPAKPAARGGKPPLAKPIAGRAVARAMRDGSALCQAFQHGQCKAGPSCPNGQHRCAAILRGDRVCGMQNHGAKECRAAKKS